MPTHKRKCELLGSSPLSSLILAGYPYVLDSLARILEQISTDPGTSINLARFPAGRQGRHRAADARGNHRVPGGSWHGADLV